MSDLNSADYYRRRQQQARALAKAAASPEIAAIHNDMADLYLDLAEEADQAQRPLRMRRA